MCRLIPKASPDIADCWSQESLIYLRLGAAVLVCRQHSLLEPEESHQHETCAARWPVRVCTLTSARLEIIAQGHPVSSLQELKFSSKSKPVRSRTCGVWRLAFWPAAQPQKRSRFMRSVLVRHTLARGHERHWVTASLQAKLLLKTSTCPAFLVSLAFIHDQ